MMRPARAWHGGILLGLVMAAGWSAARLSAGMRSGERTLARSRAPVSAAAFDSATVSVRGRLTTTARVRLAKAIDGTDAVLVLLDSADVRVCEDLGRQLRLLGRRASPGLPLVVVADPAALPSVRAFTRREKLRPAVFVALRPSDLVAGESRVPTPAAVVMRGMDASVIGVAHPRRFPNIRTRSFADELSAELPGEPGRSSPPSDRRSP